MRAIRETGEPTAEPEVYMRFLPVIKQSCDAVINITTGGGLGMSVEERLRGAAAGQAGDVLAQHGLDELRPVPARRPLPSWKFDWERPYLAGTDDYIFRNTFRDIARIMETLGKGEGVRFEHECYDVGHLYNLAHFVDRKVVEPPFFVQLIFGILGGIGADIRNLMFMKETADRLFGDDYRWSVLGAGRHQLPFATQAAMMGGNVRVGLEDSLYIGPGEMATSNASRWPRSAASSRNSASRRPRPAEARETLKLKGGDKVGF